jgi:hypothetical protein
MFKWLFRKKKDVQTMDNSHKNSNTAPIPREALAKLKIPRKFEIYVEEYTEGDIGCPAGWRPVQVDSKLGGNGGNPIITVNSQADLQEKQNFYKAVGQRFSIVREIDPPSMDDIRKAAIEQGLIKAESDPVPTEQNNENKTKPADRDPSCAKTESAVKPPEKRETKYYKVGDVEIKEENGKLYQKQWLRLSPAEAANFRIVNDGSNKIVSMKGKHIEAKKWLAIEHAAGEQINSEDIINA